MRKDRVRTADHRICLLRDPTNFDFDAGVGEPDAVFGAHHKVSTSLNHNRKNSTVPTDFDQIRSLSRFPGGAIGIKS